ncbi:MAG: hypothetical protein WAQ25_03955 [Candidatus Saccharimonas sp.]
MIHKDNINHYLVTGTAATGKSTLRNIFRDNGYETIDIDEGFASIKSIG